MEKRPNVLVFLTDQQRWDCSSLHGNPLDLMPNFDRLAREGTHVANSFTCQPVCAPARSCLQLGRYGTNTGVWKNGLNPDRTLPSLADSFRRRGYNTAYVGKWHLYDHGDGAPGPVPPDFRLGYDGWLASNILEFTSDAYQTRLFDEAGDPVDLYGYRVDACVDAAIRRVVELSAEEKPFFLFLSLIEPHHQNARDDYPAPLGLRRQYEGAWLPPDLQALAGSAPGQIPGYYGMVKRIDDALGRLYDVLVSASIADDTILLFSSDHGCHFKTRNGEYKRSLHDASIRVPTMLTGGPFTGGGHIHELVSHVDLPPTLLDACGLDIPESFEGRSMLDLMDARRSGGRAVTGRGGIGAESESQSPETSRRAAPWPEEVFIQISEAEIGRAIRSRRWKYGVQGLNSFGTPVASEHPWAPEMREAFLYDLYSDPYELVNLVEYESHRTICDRLKERLLRRMSEAGEELPTVLPPEEIRDAGQRAVDEDDYDFVPG